MSDEPFDAEREMAGILQQAGQMAKMLTAHGQEIMSGPPRRVYERVPWEQVNKYAADGWELTAVVSGGLHVMQRQFGPADAAAEILGSP